MRSCAWLVLPVAVSGLALDSLTAERLWARAPKPLLRVGAKGAGPTHANGLRVLCAEHPSVCVRLTGPTPGPALDLLVELAAALPEGSAAGSAPALLSMHVFLHSSTARLWLE